MHVHCRHSIATRHARATGVARSCHDSGGSGPAGVALVVCATTPRLYLRAVVAPRLESRPPHQFSAGEIARRHRAAGNPPRVVRIIRSLLSGGGETSTAGFVAVTSSASSARRRKQTQTRGPRPPHAEKCPTVQLRRWRRHAAPPAPESLRAGVIATWGPGRSSWVAQTTPGRLQHAPALARSRLRPAPVNRCGSANDLWRAPPGAVHRWHVSRDRH
jgi:hypothetical protein